MSMIAIITTKGIDETAKKIKKYARLLETRSKRILEDMGMAVSAVSVRDYLTGPRPSRLGRVSGDLARSVLTPRVTGNVVEIGTNLPYGATWEYGIGRPARPFLSPALKDSRGEIIEILKEHVARAKKEAFA